MHPYLKYIVWALCIYAGYCGLLFLLQRKIMFPRGMIPLPGTAEPGIAGLEKSGNPKRWKAAICGRKYIQIVL